MNKLRRLASEEFRYVFTQGPDRASSIERALEDGLNCVSLAHLAIRLTFDFKLPSDLYCLEMFQDEEHFEDVPSVRDARRYDIVWFGVDKTDAQLEEFEPIYDKSGQITNWSQSPIKHVGVIYEPDTNDPLVLHSTSRTGTNSLWRLSQFAEHKRYKKVHGIRRFIKSRQPSYGADNR